MDIKQLRRELVREGKKSIYHLIWVVLKGIARVVDVCMHGDIIKWKHFPHYWPFVRGIHQSPVNSPHKAQWRRALMFSLNGAWINGWVNNGEAGDLRHYRTQYDVTVITTRILDTRLIIPNCIVCYTDVPPVPGVSSCWGRGAFCDKL